MILSAINLLVESRVLYDHNSSIVIENDSLDDGGLTLYPLRTGHKVESGAESSLANVFTCRDGDIVFPLPRWFLYLLFRSDLLRGRLPRIRTYARRPLFDENYDYCAPGWNADSGVLIHGAHVEPALPGSPDMSLPARDRLPPHLGRMLSGFCFKSAADIANAFAMFLTGLLANLFVRDPKGLFFVDGNQPGVGKTLLVRCLGVVLDGTEPRILTFLSNDEELEKRICSQLRGCPQTLVFIDNAKAGGGSAVNSRVLEANSVAPMVSLRILGKSENITRPNDLVWVLTMNDTSLSSDLVSRGVPIQLAYEGRIEDRAFAGPQPIEYAAEHRLEILAELVGCVIAWDQAGRPNGLRSHRSAVWGERIGGMLLVAGFPEFLANYEAAASSFNSDLEVLAALAECVVHENGPFVAHPPAQLTPYQD